MEPMQDKDFDQLFKQRFEEFEVEPSTRSWQKITGELDKTSKKRKALPNFWMAAASVIILAGTILWLYKPVEVIKLRGNAETQIALKEVKQADKEPQLAVNETIAEPVETKNRFAAKSEVRTSRKADKQNALRTEQVEPEISKISDPAENVLIVSQKPVVLQTQTNLVKEKEKPVVLAVVNDEHNNAETETAKPRIRSVGGLVNFVVAQVDRREDKFIEFKDGEEGSEVSGINLGLLKFKSRNR